MGTEVTRETAKTQGRLVHRRQSEGHAGGVPRRSKRGGDAVRGPVRPGVYVSIPFCAQKCTYCNFSSQVYRRSLRTRYISCLSTELRQTDAGDPDTLYLGGGSPSMLEPEEFALVAASLPAREWAEATIEVAPGEATSGRLRQWLKAGMTRASLGVQSFDPRVARQSGRRHTPETVRSQIRLLREGGICQTSVDLIAGLAHQTSATWKRSLEWVERLDVDHVSVYMLEADDESRLGRELQSGGQRYGALHVPSEDEIVDLYLTAVERLRELGYERYEVSNFARPGARSLHNLKYWRMEPYVGYGSDAHSFNGRARRRNVPSAPQYVARVEGGRSPLDTAEELDATRLLEDRVLTGLRASDGIRLRPDEWGQLQPPARRLAARGWLRVQQPTLRLTDEGMLFADQVVLELLG